MFKIAWRDEQGQTSKVKVIDHKTFEGFVSFVNKSIEQHKKSKTTTKAAAAWFLRGPATKRTNKDLEYSNLVIGDIDDTKISPSSCSDLLSGQDITHFIYTSSSHTTNSPRYRIICPHKTKTDEENKRATAYLQSKIKGIKLASESYTWAQEWYLPFNGAERYGHIGTFKIPSDFEYQSGKESGGDQNEKGDEVEGHSSDFENHLKALREGKEIHPHSRGMCLALANVGVPEKFIVQMVWSHVEPILKERGIDDVSLRYESTLELAKTAVHKSNAEKTKTNIETNVNSRKIDTQSESKLKELNWPPGMMGDLSKSVFNYQRYQDKTMSIMTALALVAGVAGRRHNINDLGLSIYITLLADTGRGKDTMAKFINRTLYNAHKEHGKNHIGAKSFTSAKSLMSTLKQLPCKVSVITEAAFVLKSTSGSPESLRKTMLDVYTKTGQYDFAIGEVYSDEKNNIPTVRAPNFTMINESTPKMFLEAMRVNDGAEAGDYGRMFVFRVQGLKPFENFQSGYKISPEIMKRLNTLIEFNHKIKKDEDPQPIKIKRPPDYKKFSKHYTSQENKYAGVDPMRKALFSRASEKRLRLIGLCCALDGIETPTPEIIKWCTHVIEVEAKNLKRFSEGVSGDWDENAIQTVGRAMYEALAGVGSKKDSRSWDVNTTYKRNKIVSYSVIRRRTRGSAKRFDEKNGGRVTRGVDIMLKILVDSDLITELKPDDLNLLYGISQTKRSAYRMTSDLYDELEAYFNVK